MSFPGSRAGGPVDTVSAGTGDFSRAAAPHRRRRRFSRRHARGRARHAHALTAHRGDDRPLLPLQGRRAHRRRSPRHGGQHHHVRSRRQGDRARPGHDHRHRRLARGRVRDGAHAPDLVPILSPQPAPGAQPQREGPRARQADQGQPAHDAAGRRHGRPDPRRARSRSINPSRSSISTTRSARSSRPSISPSPVPARPPRAACCSGSTAGAASPPSSATRKPRCSSRCNSSMSPPSPTAPPAASTAARTFSRR